jgi:hypothetical protein
MKFNRKSVLIAVALAIVSTYVALYAVWAYNVANLYIYEDTEGNVTWRSGPSGSLFPWPGKPGMLEVLSKMSDIDLFIYRYLVRTGLLAAFSILLCVSTGVYVASRLRSGK